ncbi:breast cancer anti-estrogen resistance protein 3 isoform X1 [Osmerus mordax]|uniref:breast cancer anti-estrogen resistance protein 3 isoform X1 n=2 Tax=Osmerus mordax TaxID=8014 RepID=UPI00350F8DE5
MGPCPGGGKAWPGPASLYPWDMPLPGSEPARLASSPLIHNVIEEDQGYHTGGGKTLRTTGSSVETLDYVKFSRERVLMEGAADKMRKELEEELKTSSEEPRSHAWYHGPLPRQAAEALLQRDGDFLVRDSSSSPGSFVLTCQWRDAPQHFRITRRLVALNEAYVRQHFLLEGGTSCSQAFDSLPALVRCYVGNRTPVSQVVGAVIFQPITRGLPLRCLAEKYEGEAGLSLPERRSQAAKRLSLNLVNGHAQDSALGRGALLRTQDRCGSQPACLNQVQEKRRPLKTHQSESFLPLGSRPCGPPPPQQLLLPRCAVVRTGSEPVLSPTQHRRLTPDLQPAQAIRGSDSQLCPRPPPKPSKVAPLRMPRSPRLLVLAPPPSQPPPSTQPALTPPTPPPKPRPAQAETASPSPEVACGARAPCSPAPSPVGYVDRLKSEENGRTRLDRSSYHHAIAALENGSDEEEGGERGGAREEEEGGDGGGEREEEGGRGQRWPVFETESSFCPGGFESRLLPRENKPLEMSVLRAAKQLLLSHTHLSIAKHMLLADCQVARILGVSEEMKGQMGVSSGLELVTLPHGRQLRLDLMERHHTMAIGVAVNILGCTGSMEERASTLNRIILVAMELKDALGDLFTFSSIMKALDMPQIARLDHTWTTLRHSFTQTAITYEKTLKPFYKALYEGTAELAGAGRAMPLLIPLLNLMERGGVACEGAEPWEQGCDVMLRHLEDARRVAQDSASYTSYAQTVLHGFRAEEGLLEVFRTDFQQRLLWGSRGASVAQEERHAKFTLILTALSRKLEPAVTHTEL